MNSTAKRILSLVAAAIAIGGAVMLWNSYWRTMASIMPGVNDSSSTSMEPTDLVLRTRFFKGFKLIPENASPLEWRLRLPRSYVVSQIGDTGAVQHEAANCCFVGYHLAVVSDPKSDEFWPSVGVPAQVRQREEYIIDITNAGAVPEIAAEDNCITADQFERFMRANGNIVSARDRTCPPGTPRCRIFTHMNGWGVLLIVPRHQYAEPQKYCDATKKFLDKYTVKRDARN